jgi:Na+/H+ antiporter NhaD/arsenite permease-like protein
VISGAGGRRDLEVTSGGKKRRNIIFFTVFGLALVGALVLPELCPAATTSAGGEARPDIGKVLPIWSVIPFIGILLSIALCPLLTPKFWHQHYGKVSAFWAIVFAVPAIYVFHETAIIPILHIYIIDYIPFIILLWSLYTIAGGIVVTGTLRGTPVMNSVLLIIGTILASWVGTTGASMVMIRPVLRANRDRERKAHIICFFIFLVANIGGALTPLGDPPLFLGFLHSVPFFWVTKAILPHMLLASLIVLALFYLIDSYHYRKEKSRPVAPESPAEEIPIKVEGAYNLIFLGGVVGLVLLSGYWKAGCFTVMGIDLNHQNIVRDAGILAMGLLSLHFTPWTLREASGFGWAPIIEVAKLFAGIFMTILPALAILKAGYQGALAGLLIYVKDPAGYYWASGSLSSFLDNAPTYLTFFYMALGQLGMTEAMIPGACSIGTVTYNPEFVALLKGVSAGSVFMGANTYIGNAPNFMVKSIAEEAGVNMPSFFGYMFKYSIPILIPVFILVTFVFF